MDDVMADDNDMRRDKYYDEYDFGKGKGKGYDFGKGKGKGKPDDDHYHGKPDDDHYHGKGKGKATGKGLEPGEEPGEDEASSATDVVFFVEPGEDDETLGCKGCGKDGKGKYFYDHEGRGKGGRKGHSPPVRTCREVFTSLCSRRAN